MVLPIHYFLIGWNRELDPSKSSVCPPLFSLVMAHEDALICWKALENHLSPRKTIHSYSIRDQLRHLKKTEDMSIYEQLCDEGMSVDRCIGFYWWSIEGNGYNSFVAEGLSSEYLPFISSVHSQPNMVFEDFLHLLIWEDNFMKRETSAIIAISSSTFAANAKYSKYNKQSNQANTNHSAR